MKKVYISGRVKHGDTHVKDAIEAVEGLGYEVTYDWTRENLPKPFTQHPDTSLPSVRKMIKGAMEADVFILIWDDSLYVALIEFGVALATNTKAKPKILYIVGVKDREGIIEVLPEVRVKMSIDEVIEELKEL